MAALLASSSSEESYSLKLTCTVAGPVGTMVGAGGGRAVGTAVEATVGVVSAPGAAAMSGEATGGGISMLPGHVPVVTLSVTLPKLSK
jgi:hypothetical protein